MVACEFYGEERPHVREETRGKERRREGEAVSGCGVRPDGGGRRWGRECSSGKVAAGPDELRWSGPRELLGVRRWALGDAVGWMDRWNWLVCKNEEGMDPERE